MSSRAEIAAVLLVEEQAVLRFLQFNRKFQPLDIKGRLVKIGQALDDKGVIVSEAFDLAPALAVISIEQFALLFIDLRSEKSGRACRAFQITGLIQDLRGARIGRNHQPVPGRDNFVVQMRPRPFGADR